MIWIVFVLLLVLIVLFGICIIRALSCKSGIENDILPYTGLPSIPPDQIAERLSLAIQCKTVSHDERTNTDWREFEKLSTLLEQTYTHVHQVMKRETVDGYAYIYHWRVKNATSCPIVLMAHQDVVPAATDDGWIYPPFDGTIAEGYIWGRGALDMKSHLIAIFEALETLIASGWTPSRDIYVALGHDEETGGITSAKYIVEWFEEQHISVGCVIDEGTNSFLDGGEFGVEQTLATIAVSEKGYGVYEIYANDSGGHSSMPPAKTALKCVTLAANRASDIRFKGRLQSPMNEMLDRLIPYMPFHSKLLYANRWLFAPLVIRKLSRSLRGNAWIRSTAALNVANGAPQPNVLPLHASMTINLRLTPADRAEETTKKMNRAIKKYGVKTRHFVENAARVSRTQGAEWDLLERTIRQCFPDTIPVPSLMLGATDARYFSRICENVYRFSPFRSYQQDGDTIHAVNERITVDSLVEGAQFFMTMLLHC